MDVLGHMLDNSKHKVEGLTLLEGGYVQDQIFANDIALYLKGIQSNLDNAQSILDLFCLTSGAKLNWGKSATIWASKDKKDWEWR